MSKLTKTQIEILTALKTPGAYLEHWFGMGRFSRERTYLYKSKDERITVRNDTFWNFQGDKLITCLQQNQVLTKYIISKTGLEALAKIEAKA